MGISIYIPVPEIIYPPATWEADDFEASGSIDPAKWTKSYNGVTNGDPFITLHPNPPGTNRTCDVTMSSGEFTGDYRSILSVGSSEGGDFDIAVYFDYSYNGWPTNVDRHMMMMIVEHASGGAQMMYYVTPTLAFYQAKQGKDPVSGTSQGSVAASYEIDGGLRMKRESGTITFYRTDADTSWAWSSSGFTPYAIGAVDVQVRIQHYIWAVTPGSSDTIKSYFDNFTLTPLVAPTSGIGYQAP